MVGSVSQPTKRTTRTCSPIQVQSPIFQRTLHSGLWAILGHISRYCNIAANPCHHRKCDCYFSLHQQKFCCTQGGHVLHNPCRHLIYLIKTEIARNRWILNITMGIYGQRVSFLYDPKFIFHIINFFNKIEMPHLNTAFWRHGSRPNRHSSATTEWGRRGK